MSLLSPDRWSHFTPVGIRFWDPVLDQQIADGLVVTARPAKGDGRRVAAIQNGSGLYAFLNLPGLHGRESVVKGDTTRLPFILEVVDRLGRYQPVSYKTYLPPTAADGLLLSGSGGLSPPEGFHLFGAPTRPVLAGVGVIEGQIWDKRGSDPGRWAIMTAELPDGRIFRALADERGCFRLLLPYPSVVDASSPAETPLDQLTWPITLTVFHRESILDPNPGNPLPDWSDILRQLTKPQADLYPDTSTGLPELTVQLPYGRPLTLKTLGDSQSRFLIRSH